MDYKHNLAPLNPPEVLNKIKEFGLKEKSVLNQFRKYKIFFMSGKEVKVENKVLNIVEFKVYFILLNNSPLVIPLHLDKEVIVFHLAMLQSILRKVNSISLPNLLSEIKNNIKVIKEKFETSIEKREVNVGEWKYIIPSVAQDLKITHNN